MKLLAVLVLLVAGCSDPVVVCNHAADGGFVRQISGDVVIRTEGGTVIDCWLIPAGGRVARSPGSNQWAISGGGMRGVTFTGNVKIIHGGNTGRFIEYHVGEDVCTYAEKLQAKRQAVLSDVLWRSPCNPHKSN